MPAKAKTSKLPSNIVTALPGLPYPLTSGQITWTDAFQQKASGQITYESLPEREAIAITGVYLLKPKVVLYGILLETKRVSYDRQPAAMEEGDLDVYKVTVALEGKEASGSGFIIGIPLNSKKNKKTGTVTGGFVNYADGGEVTPFKPPTRQEVANARNSLKATLERAIAAKVSEQAALSVSSPLRAEKQREINELLAELFRAVQAGISNGSQLFSRAQIIADGANEISFDGTEYNEAEMTWGDSSTTVGEDQVETPPRSVFKLKEPKVETIEEYSEAYSSPPENTEVLRDDTSQNCDESGEKKVYKKTTRVNGEVSAEEVLTYGFAYRYVDIYDQAKQALYTESPAAHWKVVEQRFTSYNYTRTLPVQYRISVTDGGRSVRTIVHPDYKSFSNITGSAGEMQFQSNAEFLTEISAEGWKLARLKKEDEGRNSLDAEDPYSIAEVFDFKKVKLSSRTINVLAAVKTTGTLQAGVTPPFTIEFVDYESLEPRLKKMVTKESGTIDGRVGVLYPDPNYIEPLYVKAELSGSSSFSGIDDPDVEENPDQLIGGTNTIKTPRLTTGEESRNEVERTLYSPERYSERKTEYSSQDPGFDNASEHISFAEMLGSPPTPQSRIQAYEKTEVKPLQVIDKKPKTKYLVSTAGKNDVAPGSATISHPDANTFTEALDATQGDLRKESMSNSRSQKMLFGFHQGLRTGQPALSEKDLFASQGTWRITSVTWTLEYKGLVDGLGLLVVTPGTAVTLGLDKAKALSVGTRTDPSGGDSDRKSDPRVSISVSGEGLAPGSLLPNLPSRRTNN